jgi:hypothetical protein
VALPPVTVTFPVADGVVFGPSAGLEAGAPLNGYALAGGFTCNLPSEDEILAEVRRQAGSFASNFISVDRVEVNRVTLTATQGDFSTLTSVFLAFVTAGVGGIAPVPLGWASSDQGWGNTLEVVPGQPVNILSILRQPKPACGAAIISLSGTAPETDVIAGATIEMTVHLEAGLF